MSTLRPLLKEDGTPTALRELLESARGDNPTAQQLAHLSAKVGAAVGAKAALTAAGTTKVSLGVAGKVGLGVKASAMIAASVITVGTGGYFATRVLSERAPRPGVAVTAKVEPVLPPPAPPVEPEPVREEAVAKPPAPAVAVQRATPPVKSSARLNDEEPGEESAAPPPVKAIAVAAESEVELIQQALAAIAQGDLPRALERTQLHQTRFPHGALEQEREMLAIEGLLKSGQGFDARHRAEAFRQSFPTSTHLLRLKTLLAE